MNNGSMRDRNILDEGVKHHERVLVNGIGGKIVGVDFNAQMIQIEVNVSAHMVKRDDIDECECEILGSECHSCETEL